MTPAAFTDAMELVRAAIVASSVTVDIVDVGGGFPSVYPGMEPPPLEGYFEAIHRSFEDLPISSRELYRRLKQHGVLVVPGEDFFVGLDDNWQHQHECIRVSYASDAESVRKGVAIISAEVTRAYAGA